MTHRKVWTRFGTFISSIQFDYLATRHASLQITPKSILFESPPPHCLPGADHSVINPVHIQFVAALFDIPLKDKDAEKELYDQLTLLFGYVFLAHDEIDGFALKANAAEAYKTLRHRIKSDIVKATRTGIFKTWTESSEKSGSLGSYGVNLIRRLVKAGKSVDEIADIVIPSAAALAASLIQQVIFHVTSDNDLVFSNA